MWKNNSEFTKTTYTIHLLIVLRVHLGGGTHRSEAVGSLSAKQKRVFALGKGRWVVSHFEVLYG